jgi:aspartate/methionine/tyrosine aminotransferase
VVVDGTFQYTRWDGMQAEPSSRLVPERTIRLVCPTKSLCLHGVRFAYFLVPEEFYDELAYAYAKLIAGSSTFDTAVAPLMMRQLRSARNNRDLVAAVRSRYTRLRGDGMLAAPAHEPSCTYYTFTETGFKLPEILSMGGRFFELDAPETRIRVNLLAPGLDALAANARATGST